NGGREPVTVLRHGLDPFRTFLAECLAHGRDLKCEVGLLDDRVRPELPDQLVALQDPPSPLHQQQQQVERFRGQGDRPGLQTEHPRPWVEAISTELVDGGSIAHGLGCEMCRSSSRTAEAIKSNPVDAIKSPWRRYLACKWIPSILLRKTSPRSKDLLVAHA